MMGDMIVLDAHSEVDAVIPHLGHPLPIHPAGGPAPAAEAGAHAG